jgi:type IV secretion system protein VirB10
MANRATIVPQGTLIAAVLETALDSTQPGQARAVVSANVVNLIGDRVLIPRGSRLFGTYQGELAAGQKRALVQWTRLVRPDGVTIAIDSPAADRLGRAGIKGRVNTHFPERLGGALLQSAIDIGSLVTGRAIYDSSVVVAVPGATQGAASSLVGQAPKPTLRVRQGTRISVFVARDLDFTSVEARR